MRPWLLVLVLAACSVNADFGGTSYRCPDGVCPAGQTCVSGMCVEETPAVDAPPSPADAPISDASLPDATPPDAPPQFSPPWWDMNYALRNRLSVTNNATQTAPAGLQVRWIFNLQGDLAITISDSDTLRIVYWDGTSYTELNRIIDDTAANTEYLWVRLVADIPPGATDDSYYFYYSADPLVVGDAPDVSDAMWGFYDGFNGSFDATDWNVNPSGATISLVSGQAVLDVGESIRTNYQIGVNEAADFTIEATGTATRWWGGLQIADTFAPNQPWAVWITRSDNAGNIWPEIQADAAGITAPALGPTSPLVAGEDHLYTVIRQADRIIWEREGIEVHTQSVPTTWTEPMNIRFTNESANDVLVGFARTRQYLRPFPTTQILELEMLP